MSGDVQPRKRKDKRRKKDFSSPVQHTDISAPKMVKADEAPEDIGPFNPEEVIHVQKDALLGGNICAKVVFFCLLGAIGVMVGLIIVEYRGSKDVTLQSDIDSPWSQMLEGWIDSTSSIHHDDHDHEEDEGLGETSGEEHSEEDHDEHGDDEDDGEHEHDEDEHDEEHKVDHDDEEEEEENENSVLEDGIDEDDADNVSGEENKEEEEDEEEEEEEDGDDNDDETDNAEEDEEEGVENKSDEAIDEDLEQGDEDGVDEDKSYESGEADDDDDQETGDTDNDDDEAEEEVDDDDEIPEIMETGVDDNDEDLGESVDDQSYLKDELSEETEDEENKEVLDDFEQQEADEGEGTEQDGAEEETSGVALKFGVGVALVVVAHVVLVRKWNSAGEENVTAQKEADSVIEHIPEPEAVPESLTRRQTLVAPPPVEELAPIKPPSPEPEYSNDEAEGEEEEEEEEEDEEEESEKIKQTLEELKQTYSHLTPEGSDLEEDDYDNKVASKNYTYTPTPPESEQEQSEPEAEEDEDEEEEEEDDPMRQWQSRQAADLLAEEVEDVQTGTEEEEESDDEPPSPSVRRKGPQENEQTEQQPESNQNFINAETTNQYDWDFQEELDAADKELNEGHAERALNLFTSLLARAPYSPRAHHGKAKAIDQLAEKQKSNQLLVKAIMAYNDALNVPDIPDKLFIEIANRTIDRMRFKGMHLDAVKIHNKLINRFHNIPQYRSQLAVTYLMINRLLDAKMVLEMSLERWPQDGLSNCLYGLLLKLQGNFSSAVPHLKLGIDSNENGTQESNFFFHLGDALVRIGQPEEAMKVYEKGTEKGLFLSKYQRSLYNVDRLTARPWWTLEQTTYQDFFRKLEKNWKIIREEGISALKAKKGFLNESESLRRTGDWKQFEIFARGRKSVKNCINAAVTCQLIESFSPASGCRRGQTKFSVMEAGTHVWPHCGPTNSRLRAHLGLVVPPKTYIRVADEIRSWEEGKVIIFDDSFEHEVWHNGTDQRLVLIVDVWHPELTQVERQTLSAI